MHSKNSLIIALLALLLTLTACGMFGAGRPASEMLPPMETFNKLDYDDLNTAMEALGLVATIRSNPSLAVQLAAVDLAIQCLRKSGALEIAVYSGIVNPLSAGAVLVINEARIVDINTVLACLPSRLRSDAAFDPCYKNWRYVESNVTYFMFYVGTDANFCQAACDGMAGCMP